MDGIVERIPQLLQVTFGKFADDAARATGFIQRQRRFSGSDFVRVLTFGWLACPKDSVESLASDLGITGSALQQRFTEPAANFLWTVLQSAVAQMIASRPARIPLLAKFRGVYAEDCSTISLPPELAEKFKGCGGSDEDSGKAALRLFASYELKTGTLRTLEKAQARGIDAVVAKQHAPQLPAGALRLRDMGFFDRELFTQDTAAGVYWISRVPAYMTVQTNDGPSLPVSQFLAQQPASVQQLDCWLLVGRKQKKGDQKVLPLKCRFLAVRCPPEVAAKRRQKAQDKARKKGRAASQRQLAMCDWTVLITNVSAEILSIAEAWELYSSRWQIELLFKRWKSLGKAQPSTKVNPYRALCELYAKLLGVLVSHWFTLIRGGPLEGFSLTKAIQRIQRKAEALAEALDCAESLEKLVAKIARWILQLRPQQKRKKRPSTRQRLFHTRLKA